MSNFQINFMQNIQKQKPALFEFYRLLFS
jgi:hypothetical protein